MKEGVLYFIFGLLGTVSPRTMRHTFFWVTYTVSTPVDDFEVTKLYLDAIEHSDADFSSIKNFMLKSKRKMNPKPSRTSISLPGESNFRHFL
jgi:hypothetical protein